MTTLHNGHADTDARGEAFLRCLAELERVLMQFGRNRADATRLAAAVLLDGIPNAENTATQG
jgi:hypothetical protein